MSPFHLTFSFSFAGTGVPTWCGRSVAFPAGTIMKKTALVDAVCQGLPHSVCTTQTETVSFYWMLTVVLWFLPFHH